MIEQIILNLISNSIKYSAIGTDKPTHIFINLCSDNNYLNLTFKDNGSGIPSSKASYIFKRFSQVNNLFSRKNDCNGNGIGLPLVKALIELHNGTITLVNSKSACEFNILLPLVKTPSAREIALTNYSYINNSEICEKINIEFSNLNT